MKSKINNLVFEGGGTLGIAYLGVLDCLSSLNILQGIERVAGTSAGAITACIVSFNLSFPEIVAISNTLDYKQVPDPKGTGDDEIFSSINEVALKQINTIFGDIRCVYRLLKRYGWFSTDYFYSWLQTQIAKQFNPLLKAPPYTFADFKNTAIHKDEHPFLDLRIIGTNVSYGISNIFSYETTPDMEVAQAVRISMAVPFFFESIPVPVKEFFCDGGVVRNYPIAIFDLDNAIQTEKSGIQHLTLGSHFDDYISYSHINNLLDYIENILSSFLKVQVNSFLKEPNDVKRTIQINPGPLNALNFNITPYDMTYNALYKSGYTATQKYFALYPELISNLITP